MSSKIIFIGGDKVFIIIDKEEDFKALVNESEVWFRQLFSVVSENSIYLSYLGSKYMNL